MKYLGNSRPGNGNRDPLILGKVKLQRAQAGVREESRPTAGPFLAYGPDMATRQWLFCHAPFLSVLGMPCHQCMYAYL